MQRRDFIATGALTTLGTLSGSAWAQTYPARAVRMIIPFSPGGPTDVMGRTVAKAMGEHLGQQFVVENRAGAGGNIGTDAVAKATADGYTVGISAISSLAIAPHLYSNLPFDVARDLAPIALVGTTPCALVINPGAPFTDLNGMIAYAKTHPGEMNYATSGVGTSNHLAAELLQSAAGIELTHVPYKGSSQIVPDLLSGTVMMSMESSLVTTLQYIKSGKLRALAVTSPQRSRFLPDIPTVAESGYPGFEMETWFGLVAPSATPQNVITTLNNAWVTGARTSQAQTTFDNISANLRANTPQEFAAFIRSESQRWGALIQRLNIQVN